ncbi:MAG: hypothetical protein KJI71_01355 [Patescibacteria group bacterium]|nr:hypothetical protein [Patescibacteria group bacterium]
MSFNVTCKNCGSPKQQHHHDKEINLKHKGDTRKCDNCGITYQEHCEKYDVDFDYTDFAAKWIKKAGENEDL